MLVGVAETRRSLWFLFKQMSNSEPFSARDLLGIRYGLIPVLLGIGFCLKGEFGVGAASILIGTMCLVAGLLLQARAERSGLGDKERQIEAERWEALERAGPLSRRAELSLSAFAIVLFMIACLLIFRFA